MPITLPARAVAGASSAGLDFNDAPSQEAALAAIARPSIDAADLKRQLEGQIDQVLAYLWPAGKRVGDEFHVGSINGERGNSLKISLKRERLGVGADFAGNAVFGDIIDAWSFATKGRKVKGIEFAEMCEEIANWLGTATKPKPKPAEKAKPVELGPPTASWNYTDEAGKILVTITRYDPSGQKKVFRQWDARRNAHNMPDADRPLFNLPGIKHEAVIVFAEGEKAATALIKAGIPATCSMGGTKTIVEKTAWAPLAGKTVIIWPDADEPGAVYAETIRGIVDGLGSTAIVMTPLAGKTDGWDAADAIEEGLDPKALLSGLIPAQRPQAARTLDLKRWAASSFAGEPKPIEWCVENLLPRAKAGLLVAMGDAGKGILTLDLALKVAMDKPSGGPLESAPTCMGQRVLATGSVVILAAEDDSDTIHRRLASLDSDGAKRASGRLYVVPLPNGGGPLPIVKNSSTQGPFVTPEWEMMRRELRAIPDLALLVLDPLASFVHADINADPAAGAYVTGQLASLATETGATVLLPHHMAKRDRPITSPEEARAAIRGSTAIVDGVRFAYALWHVEEQEARRICEALGEEWQRNRVLRGAIVKSNDPADRTMRTYVRSLKTGLLVDRSDTIRGNKGLQRNIQLDQLADAIMSAASAGFPYTKAGGSTGVWERRHEFPECIHNVGRQSLRDMVDELCETKRLVQVRYKGQGSQWLDDPEGGFAKGFVDLQTGAYKP